MKKNNKVLLIISLIVIFICAFFYLILPQISKTQKNLPLSTHVKKEEFVINVSMVGNIKAKKSLTVNSPVEGKIVKLCKEGTLVKPGDFLVLLDTSQYETELMEKQISYQDAQNEEINSMEDLEITSLENELSTKKAMADLEYNKAELMASKVKLERQKRLLKEQLVTKQDVEEAENQLRSKELAVKKSQFEVEVQQKQAESKDNQKKANVNNKKANLAVKSEQLNEIKKKISDATVYSPASGLVVYKETWKGSDRGKIAEGDEMYRGEALLELPDLSNMQVLSKVEEMRISKIKLKQVATVKIDAFPDKTFHAVVSEISRLATELKWWEGGLPGRRYFEVTLELKEPDQSVIRPGATVNVEILIKKIKDAVFVPKECIFEKENGETFVYLLKGRKITEQTVKTGDDNENFIVITQGLSGGENILLARPGEENEEGKKEEKIELPKEKPKK